MVRKIDEWPAKGELVIAKVKNLEPYGCFVELLEYQKEGMVHISEISSRWVKNIRNFVKPGRQVVLKVLQVDQARNRIDLSLKKVTDQEKGKKLEEWNRENRAEKLLERAGKELNKSLEEAYQEAGDLLIEEYYTLYKGLEEAALRGKEALEEAGLPKEWVNALAKIAKQEIKIPEKEIKGILKLKTYEPNGIELIKKGLGKVANGIKITYISAPRYRITARAKQYKVAEEKLNQAIKQLEKEFKGKVMLEFERE